MGTYAPYRDERVTDFVFALRVAAEKDCASGDVLCRPYSGQASCVNMPECILQPGGWIVLDFGRELHGGIDITTGWLGKMERDILVTFGESVMETFLIRNMAIPRRRSRCGCLPTLRFPAENWGSGL